MKTVHGNIHQQKYILVVGFKVIWGGSDSCQGDSGGPLYTMEDGRAVLVGLVRFLDSLKMLWQLHTYIIAMHYSSSITAT